MKPEAAAAALTGHVEALKESLELAKEPFARAVRQTADALKVDASRRGYAITIRVYDGPRGPRMAITGRSAPRYRQLAAEQLTARRARAADEAHRLLRRT